MREIRCANVISTKSTRTTFGYLSKSSTSSSSSKFLNHLKEDLPSALIQSTMSLPALKIDSNHLPSNSSPNSKKILGPNKKLISLLTKSVVRKHQKPSYLLSLYLLQIIVRHFLAHHPIITHIISKMIFHHLTSVSKSWDSTKPWICLDLKSPIRKFQDHSKPSVLLTLAHLPTASPRLKLQNTLRLPPRLASSHHLASVSLVLLHLVAGV